MISGPEDISTVYASTFDQINVGEEARKVDAMRYPLAKEHPTWSCKREGCKGTLTLLGSVRNAYSRLEGAKKRAEFCRKQYPVTYWHGSILSCDQCGDRPETSKRRKMWQRLCVVCGEPFAMNSFWRCHGGVTNKGATHSLDSRVSVHKKKMRKWAHFHPLKPEMLATLMDSQMEEFKWLSLASTGRINPLKYPISSSALKPFFNEEDKKVNMRLSCGKSGSQTPYNQWASSVMDERGTFVVNPSGRVAPHVNSQSHNMMMSHLSHPMNLMGSLHGDLPRGMFPPPSRGTLMGMNLQRAAYERGRYHAESQKKMSTKRGMMVTTISSSEPQTKKSRVAVDRTANDPGVDDVPSKTRPSPPVLLPMPARTTPLCTQWVSGIAKNLVNLSRSGTHSFQTSS